MTEPRGRTSWKPNARTRALAADIHAVLAEYRDYLPVTGRQVYYRLIGQYGLPKGARGRPERRAASSSACGAPQTRSFTSRSTPSATTAV